MTSPEIRCVLTGKLLPPSIQQQQQPTLEQHRLTASLYMLSGSSELVLVNEPIEIARQDNENQCNFDVLVAFQGLDPTTIKHPLLESIETNQKMEGICVVLKLISVDKEGRQRVTSFGGMGIDTQGLALGGEVRGTLLMYNTVDERNYNQVVLRKVLEGQGDRMVLQNFLQQQSMHVKINVTASHRRTNAIVSRSLMHTWDRTNRNTICISIDVDDGSTLENEPNAQILPYDVSIALVNNQDERTIPYSMTDAVQCQPAKFAVHLPCLYYPFPAETILKQAWSHKIFSANNVISKTAINSSIQIIIRNAENEVVGDVVLPLRDWRGFDSEILTSTSFFDIDIDGCQSPLVLSLSVQLFSDKMPASPSLTCLANCCNMKAKFPPGGSEQMILERLSHDQLMACNFDELGPFTITLLDGAMRLFELYPEDSKVCLASFGFIMRTIASSYAVLQKNNNTNNQSSSTTAASSDSTLYTSVKKWLNLHYNGTNMGMKILKVIAISFMSNGHSIGLGSGKIGGDLGGEMMNHYWPSIVSNPSNAEEILFLTWVPLVKLAFRSHQCTANISEVQLVVVVSTILLLVLQNCLTVLQFGVRKAFVMHHLLK